MPKSSTRVTLRQLCGLGLPAAMVLPSLLPVLRQVVRADHAAFFFCDAHGQITNLYAERMLPPQAMASYYQRHYESDFRVKYLQRVSAANPVSSHSLSAQERASPYYREVLSVLGGDHILYAIVRRGSRVLGQLSMYRGAGAAPFSEADEQALASVIHYLGDALAVPTPTALIDVHARVAEEAIAVLTPAGDLIYADDQWDRLVRLAHGDAIAPAMAQAEGRALPLFVRTVLTAALATPNASHRVESAWGSFTFRRHALSAAEGAQAIALRISRLTAEPLQLTLGAAALELSPKQREVALLLAGGATNAQIAQRLNVSLNTASHHVKQVFARLGVHDRGAVEQALRGSNPST